MRRRLRNCVNRSRKCVTVVVEVKGQSSEVRVTKPSHLCMAPLEGWRGWCPALSEVVSSSSLLLEALSRPDSLKKGAGEGGREGGSEGRREGVSEGGRGGRGMINVWEGNLSSGTSDKGSEIGTTSLQRTKLLAPRCPLFGGSTVFIRRGTNGKEKEMEREKEEGGVYVTNGEKAFSVYSSSHCLVSWQRLPRDTCVGDRER